MVKIWELTTLVITIFDPDITIFTERSSPLITCDIVRNRSTDKIVTNELNSVVHILVGTMVLNNTAYEETRTIKPIRS